MSVNMVFIGIRRTLKNSCVSYTKIEMKRILLPSDGSGSCKRIIKCLPRDTGSKEENVAFKHKS